MIRAGVLASLLPVVFALAACGGAGGGTPTPAPTPTPAVPPNVIVILADDMGWGDLSSFGSSTIRTPNLDQMAAEGVRLTSFYTPSAVCAPSRAALLTGRWGIRVGIPWNPAERLNDGEITIADSLRGRGYATALVGKWHIGWRPPDTPIHHGFDSYFGLLSGEDVSDLLVDDQPSDERIPLEQITARYTDEAIAFLERTPRNRPFFLYLAHRSPHLPSFPSNEFLGRSADGAYGDTVEEMDHHIGRLLAALRTAGIDDNTLVIFTSDNGPPEGVGSTGPFSGRKFQIGEGGVRMPAIARWPARIPRGRVVDEPTSTLDLFPTLLALAGGAPPTDRVYDGGDITKVLTGEAATLPGPGLEGNREIVFWNSYTPAALRAGRWKYARRYSGELPPTLFDLQADPGETRSLWEDRPDIAGPLEVRLAELTKGL